MAELPGLVAGNYVPFLFYKSQAASAHREPVFFVLILQKKNVD
jgi:hypothetical protein